MTPSIDSGRQAFAQMFDLQTASDPPFPKVEAGPPSTDPQTGLPDSRAFQRAYQRATVEALRAGEPMSIALLGLDQFDDVRGLGGPELAEEVLCRVARLLAASFRRTDVFARWAGESFAIVLPRTNERGAIRALEKSMRVLENERFLTPAGEPFPVTLSCGLTEVEPGAPFAEVIGGVGRLLNLARLEGGCRIRYPGGEVAPLDRRILLVQSDAISASVIRYRLRGEGTVIEHFAEGRPALAEIERLIPSLVVIDLNLTDMDGLELLALLRDTRALDGMGIVVLSYLEGDMERSFDLGADDFILKPFSPDELRARVQRLLKKR